MSSAGTWLHLLSIDACMQISFPGKSLPKNIKWHAKQFRVQYKNWMKNLETLQDNKSISEIFIIITESFKNILRIMYYWIGCLKTPCFCTCFLKVTKRDFPEISSQNNRIRDERHTFNCINWIIVNFRPKAKINTCKQSPQHPGINRCEQWNNTATSTLAYWTWIQQHHKMADWYT